MPDPAPGEITQLLSRAKDGDSGAREKLYEALYPLMKSVAGFLMQHERAGHTLQPSALFHEAFLRLEEGQVMGAAQDRKYLIGAICSAMRRVLVDHARHRKTEKRAGTVERIPLDVVCDLVEQEHRCDLVELNELLELLAAVDERAGQVVELRFFGGFTMDEIAVELTVSKSTVESDWRFAQAWLHRQLRSE
jgi:RNA polymerase sigma factor (TIGR02999 family)